MPFVPNRHRFGFDASNWRTLQKSLLHHVEVAENATALETQFGTKYMIEASLETPDGRRPHRRPTGSCKPETLAGW